MKQSPHYSNLVLLGIANTGLWNAGFGIPAIFYRGKKIEIWNSWKKPKEVIRLTCMKDLEIQRWHHVEYMAKKTSDGIYLGLNINNETVDRETQETTSSQFKNVVWYQSYYHQSWGSIKEFANVKNLRYCTMNDDCCEDL